LPSGIAGHLGHDAGPIGRSTTSEVCMPSQLVCRPEKDLPVAVLRVSGVLDGDTAHALDSAVRERLAGRPEAVLIDVSAVEIGDPRGLSALAAVVDETADWPGVPIVLCGARPQTARAIAGSPVHDRVATADDCTRALAEFAAGTRTRRLRLRPVPDSCRQARQFVTQAFTAWQVGGLVSTGTLVVTELVANVVRHARTGMDLTVELRDGRIRVSVRDGSTHLPRAADPGLSDAGGRGLRLIRELTDAWGVLPVPGGKVVWAALPPALP
jgi:anti-anti-sigma regulatory factor